MSHVVPSCRRADNARSTSPAPIVLVARLCRDGSSRLLLRGVFEGSREAAVRHADVVFAEMRRRHGQDGQVVVQLLDELRRPFHRVAERACAGGVR